MIFHLILPSLTKKSYWQASIAYHLAKSGVPDVLLLERDRLTCGTTWHAAGLMVTFGSLSHTSTEWRKYTKELYATVLPEETGMETGFKPCGFIELATSPGTLEEYRRIAAFNRYCGVDVNELKPEEVLQRFPILSLDGVLAGFEVPTDGRVNPYDAAMAFARAAKNMGAAIIEGHKVLRVTTSPSGFKNGPRASGVAVEGPDGSEVRVAANAVVNAGGMWGRQFAEAHGVAVPNQAAEHYYLITEEMEQVDPEWPVVEDPSRHVYIRPEGGGLMLGLFEPEGAVWNEGKIPDDFR